jgi:tRNA-dihydrouridine synthase B
MGPGSGGAAPAGIDIGSPLRIGRVELANRLILAPMAGITDRPFRELCRRFGAGLAVAEMVSADPRLAGLKKSRERLDHSGERGPIAVQLLGNDPQMLAEAARRQADLGAQLIDINLGCPAKKVCRRVAGSALLRDEPLVGRLLAAVVGAVDVPVTLKTRTGWCPQTRNLPRIARIAEDSGIALLTVHGRTRACGFNGQAEHDSLAAVRDQVSIPLVANGDIDSPESVRRVLARTGADAVMIGRAALGRPWLFRDIAEALGGLRAAGHATDSPLHEILPAHLEALYAFYGEGRGVRIARKHIAWYLRPRPVRPGQGSAVADRGAMALVQQAQTAKEQQARVGELLLADRPMGEMP